MFVRRLIIERITPTGDVTACPLKWIDSFAMRGFTNDAMFDDTLPVADGAMEVGLHVPLALLADGMTDWFRRKGYLQAGERVSVREAPLEQTATAVH